MISYFIDFLLLQPCCNQKFFHLLKVTNRTQSLEARIEIEENNSNSAREKMVNHLYGLTEVVVDVIG